MGSIIDAGSTGGRRSFGRRALVVVLVFLFFVAAAQPAFAVCGNGLLDAEECDDGNNAKGDGCDPNCAVEPCWTCSGEPSVCTSGPSSVTSVDTTGDVGRQSSIAIGADGLAIVGYRDTTNLDLKVAHCEDASCSTATITTVDADGNVGAFSSIAIGSDGLPVIAHRDAATVCTPPPFSTCQTGILKVTHCNDISCSTSTTVPQVAASVDADKMSIIVGTDGLPRITYRSRATSFGATSTAIRTVHCADLTCSSLDAAVLIEAKESFQGATGIALASTVGADGYPLLAWGNDSISNSGQRMAHCSDQTCFAFSLRTVDPDDDGFANSIALGGDSFGQRRAQPGAVRRRDAAYPRRLPG